MWHLRDYSRGGLSDLGRRRLCETAERHGKLHRCDQASRLPAAQRLGAPVEAVLDGRRTLPFL